MPTQFTYKGETLTLATEEELRTAIMLGKLVEHENGLSRYRYRGLDYLVSDHDLQEMKCTTPSSS